MAAPCGLELAFDRLEQEEHLVCKHDFSCCGICANVHIDAFHTPGSTGYCLYTSQLLDGALLTGKLSLGYSGGPLELALV